MLPSEHFKMENLLPIGNKNIEVTFNIQTEVTIATSFIYVAYDQVTPFSHKIEDS